ncbi:hypothetical protein AB1N83_005581 [Pleurotus pulmonarius]
MQARPCQAHGFDGETSTANHSASARHKPPLPQNSDWSDYSISHQPPTSRGFDTDVRSTMETRHFMHATRPCDRDSMATLPPYDILPPTVSMRSLTLYLILVGTSIGENTVASRTRRDAGDSTISYYRVRYNTVLPPSFHRPEQR